MNNGRTVFSQLIDHLLVHESRRCLTMALLESLRLR
jgi:hypothetical protein